MQKLGMLTLHHYLLIVFGRQSGKAEEGPSYSVLMISPGSAAKDRTLYPPSNTTSSISHRANEKCPLEATLPRFKSNLCD